MQLGAGLALCLAAWIALRRTVGAPWLLGAPGPGRVTSALLDLFPMMAGFVLALAALGRPVLAGLALAAPAIGLIVTDRVKRVVLDEPVMFADRAELWEVVRHPRLYIPFVGVVPMVAGTLAIVAAVAGLIRAEPPLWPLPTGRGLLTTAGAVLIAVALFRVPRRPAIVAALARCYEGWAPARDPAVDAARYGMLATFAVQATIAAAERPGRQAAARTPGLPALAAGGGGPIVIVQAESFVLPNRLDPALAGAAPHFARLAGEAVQAGRFAVPCWGANTIRTEFEALTGIDTRRLGLDRFNPYEAFAQVALPSLAQAARAAGRRAICLHPYDRRFYARDKVLPALGFDRFVGIEGFAGAPRSGPYVTDVALAERIAAVVAEEGPDVLVFAMSMENHGPWNGGDDTPAALPPHLAALPHAAGFARWLARAGRTDAMLPVLTRALAGTGGWLAFYGDHQPSFPGLFARMGLHDRDADYLIWRDGAPGAGARANLAAYALAPTLLDFIAAAGQTPA